MLLLKVLDFKALLSLDKIYVLQSSYALLKDLTILLDLALGVLEKIICIDYAVVRYFAQALHEDNVL